MLGVFFLVPSSNSSRARSSARAVAASTWAPNALFRWRPSRRSQGAKRLSSSARFMAARSALSIFSSRWRRPVTKWAERRVEYVNARTQNPQDRWNCQIKWKYNEIYGSVLRFLIKHFGSRTMPDTGTELRPALRSKSKRALHFPPSCSLLNSTGNF